MAGGASTLRFRTFGGMSIDLDGRELVDALPLKAALLTVYLADRGQPVSRSALAGLLWSDATEDRARARLRVLLTRMRSVIGDLLVTDRASVRIVGEIDLDAAVVEQTSDTDPVDWYRGPFLDGVDVGDDDLFAEWVTSRRRHLHELVIQRLADVADRAAARGAWMRARTLAASAEMFAARGEPGDDARAHEAASEAHDLATDGDYREVASSASAVLAAGS